MRTAAAIIVSACFSIHSRLNNFWTLFFCSRFTTSETLNYLWISTTWCNTHSVQDQLHFSDYAKRPSDSVHSYRPLCTAPRGKTLECNHATTALHSFYSAAQLPANRVSRGAPTYVTPRRTKRAETKLHFGPTRSTIGPNEAPPRRRSQWDSVRDSPSDLYISTHSHSVNGPMVSHMMSAVKRKTCNKFVLIRHNTRI